MDYAAYYGVSLDLFLHLEFNWLVESRRHFRCHLVIDL